jgi:hypothetical protein
MEFNPSVSELDVVDAGSSVSMNPSDKTWISGVSMDIREASESWFDRETTDIESEVPDDETSESVDATRSRNRHCWVVRWCSLSSSSKTVRIVGVGIVFDVISTYLGSAVFIIMRDLIMPRIYMAAESYVKCILFSFSSFLLFRVFMVAIFDFIFDFIFVCLQPK